MAASRDPIDKFIPEIRALLRRVFDAGGEAVVERVKAYVLANSTESDSGKPATEPPLPGIAPHESGNGTRQRKYPYGTVKKTVTALLLDNEHGLTRQQLGIAAHTTKGVLIDDGAIKNALKAMMSKGEVTARDGIYFPGPKLKA